MVTLESLSQVRQWHDCMRRLAIPSVYPHLLAHRYLKVFQALHTSALLPRYYDSRRSLVFENLQIRPKAASASQTESCLRSKYRSSKEFPITLNTLAF